MCASTSRCRLPRCDFAQRARLTNEHNRAVVVSHDCSVETWLVGTYNSSEKGKDRSESGSPMLSSSTIVAKRVSVRVNGLSIKKMVAVVRTITA
jgi:hypothetical protein